MRRKTRKKKRALRRSSLLLIKKFTDFLSEHRLQLNEKDRSMLDTIKRVYSQQYAWFHKHIKLKNRIVSLHKDHLHQIVRRREVKQVQFEAKLNKIQCHRINCIDH